MIKMLISSLMLAMLTGCVSPYYPMPDSASGSNERVSRAAYNDAYYEDSYVASPAYYDVAYYPWWSMDYFYLGNHYYRPSYGVSFSLGIHSGYPYFGPYGYPAYYSAWYAPYYYYSPWYGYRYSWGGYGRYDPYWRHGYVRQAGRSPRYGSPGGRDQGHGSYRDNEHVGYSGEARSREDYRQGGERDFRGHRQPQAGDGSDQRQTGTVGTNRNVSVAPSQGTTDQGMVIVNRGDGKTRPSRVEPVSRQGTAQAVPPRPPANNPSQRPVRRYSVPDRPTPKDSGDDGDRQAPNSNPNPDNRSRKDRQ